MTYDWLVSQYQSNEFLVGTTVPFALASAGYLGARLGRASYGAARRALTVSIRLNSDKPYYDEFCEAVTSEVVVPWSRQTAILSYDYERNESYSGVGYGRNFGKFGNTPVLIERDVVESHSREFKEAMSLTAFTFRKADFVRRISALYDRAAKRVDVSNTLTVYRANPYLTRMFQKQKREWETLILPSGFVSNLEARIQEILDARNEPLFTGNHTLGIMLYGSPGTGKSSLAHAISSYLGKNMIYYAGGDVTEVRVNTDRDCLLLEDVDASSLLCRASDRDNSAPKGEEKSSSSMSDVLNFLDGPMTPPGLTVIATTNRIDVLDPAFIRKGRFSVLINTDTMEITDLRTTRMAA